MIFMTFLDSVFELVSNEDRSKMEAAKMQGDILNKQQQTEKPPAVVGSSSSTPTAVGKFSAGFKPFAKFPEKQKRYEEYLDAIKHGNATS